MKVQESRRMTKITEHSVTKIMNDSVCIMHSLCFFINTPRVQL